MQVFRLSRKKFSENILGKGAALHGARWNSVSVELIYTASNRSLAMAEVAVHFTWATLPTDYVMMTIEIPDDIPIFAINILDLPSNWNIFPHIKETQIIGDKLVINSEFCVFKVPSSVTKGDFNILINPNHNDFSRIKIHNLDTFPFDMRIFK